MRGRGPDQNLKDQNEIPRQITHVQHGCALRRHPGTPGAVHAIIQHVIAAAGIQQLELRSLVHHHTFRFGRFVKCVVLDLHPVKQHRSERQLHLSVLERVVILDLAHHRPGPLRKSRVKQQRHEQHREHRLVDRLQSRQRF